ncbi:hypothetical protein [Botryobacter ruber]|uniref:hypothetical protein n=1 Tax=Botryobacter ruber TaxID=2171629 RepID=UPI000FEC6DB9|nr:hypothetical protein [Botryobacter ruber]
MLYGQSIMSYLKTIKRYIYIALDAHRNERFMLFAFLLTIFVVGTNINEQVIPDVVLLPLSVILCLVGVVCFAAFIYWTIFFWNKYSTEHRILILIKGIIYTFLFLLAGSFTYSIYFYG